MPPPLSDADGLLIVADVLSTNATSGEIRAQIGDVATAEGFAGEVALYGPDGFVGRPNDPASGQAAQALAIADGDGLKIIGTRDNRFAAKVGTMAPGDRAIVTDGEARVMVKQERDAVVLYTENQPAAKSMMIDLGGAEGQLTILNGGAFIKIMNDEITLAVNGGGAIIISADGVQITGACFQATTGAVQLGDVGGGVAPLPTPLNAVAYSVAGPANVVSTKVFVAT